MLQYIIDFLRSRKKDKGDCILCEYEGCGAVAVDVHHITPSFRGKRTHRKDGKDLIALCRKHHDEVHAKNTHEVRAALYKMVIDILNALELL